MMEMNVNTILEPISFPIFTEVLKWSPEELQKLLAEVRKDIADLEIHAFMTLYSPPSPFPSMILLSHIQVLT